MHKNVKLMKKVFSTICGFFPIYPKMSIKFPIPRAPGPIPKMTVTALVLPILTDRSNFKVQKGNTENGLSTGI